MSKRSLSVFVASFFVSYLVVLGGCRYWKNLQEKSDDKEIKVVQEVIEDRFKLFLAAPLSVATLGAEYFSEGDLQTKSYGPFSDNLLRLNREILGLSIMDASGEIIRVYPLKTNPNTVGNVSQNLTELKESVSKGEKLWFSSPFHLFQGETGFAFYVPIRADGKLKGWFAAVLSGKEFFKKFRLNKFLKTYDLIILDEETQIPYFASGLDQEIRESHITRATIENRKITFKCWRKEPILAENLPWYVSFLISLTTALLSAFIFQLLEQKKVANAQLKDIQLLLKLTSREAATKLIDLKTDKHYGVKEVTYISNLIEQIDLLQSMASAEDDLPEQHYELLPLVHAQLEDMREIIDKKNIRIIFDYKSMSVLTVLGNQKLVQNSVIHHVLFHLLVYTSESSSLEIFHQEKDHSSELIFHAHKVTGPEAFRPERRFEVAKKVMNLCGGRLSMENSDSHGMLIKLIFPVVGKNNPG